MPIAAPDRQSPSRGTRAPRNHLLHHCHRSRSRRHCSRVDGPCVGLRGPRSGQRRQAICPSWPPDRPGPPRGTEGPPVALAFDPHAGRAWRPWISPAARCARCPVARSGLSVGTVCGTRLSEFNRFTMGGCFCGIPCPPGGIVLTHHLFRVKKRAHPLRKHTGHGRVGAVHSLKVAGGPV